MTASITAMQTPAKQVEAAADGISAAVEQSEEDVKTHMETKTGAN